MLLACGPGSNYLKVCAQAALNDTGARSACEGLAAVLGGVLPLFTLRYPCHTAQRQQWLLRHVAPLAAGGALVSPIDVTDWSPALQPPQVARP